MLKLNKFLVQAILLDVDEEGYVVGELSSDTAVVYGYEGLKQYAEEAEGNINELSLQRDRDQAAGSQAHPQED